MTKTETTVAPAPGPHPAPNPHPPAHDEEQIALPAAPTPRARTLVATVAGILAVVAILFVVGLVPKVVRARELTSGANEVAGGLPRVKVVHPRSAAAGGVVNLPGSVEPLRETWMYARASGFVHDWLVDIGDKVTEGQALLELDTPELDAELIQAKANVAQALTGVEQAKANRELAKVTANRYEKLGPSGVASQQDVEEKRTQLTVADANVKAAQAAMDSQTAAVSRLVFLKSFAKVVAPFSGRITARNVERGQLVNAGNSGGQGLFELAQVETVRIFVHVPQDMAPEVQLGQTVLVTVREYPGRTFTGKVTHTAGALDPASRSLNTEVQIPNADQGLLAGMYVQAQIQLGASKPTLRVPAAALVADSHGTRLMTVDKSNHLKSVPIQVGRDLGSEIEVTDGLKGDEDVATMVPEGTPDGAAVDIVGADAARS